jgi:hypothetical protein
MGSRDTECETRTRSEWGIGGKALHTGAAGGMRSAAQ